MRRADRGHLVIATAPAAPRYAAPVRAAGTRRYTLAVIALLVFGFGEGAARGVAANLGWQSPYTVLFPFLAIAVLIIVLMQGRISLRLAVQLLAFMAFSVVVLAIQVNVFRSANLYGYFQLILFSALILVVAGLFSDATEVLARCFRRGIVIAHYTMTGYIVMVYFGWLAIGRDLSITAVITGSESPVNAYYGFRPAGLSTEPAWAAFALTASYAAIYLLEPRHAMRAFIALAVAVAALHSVTAFLFMGVLVVAPALEQRWRIRRGQSFVLASVGVALMFSLLSTRLSAVVEGTDGSMTMRLSSAAVAWDVVVDALPGGVGYGNFQQHAVYTGSLAEFAAVTSSYKSDILILNLIAELGLAGAVLYGWIASVIGRARHLLVWAYFIGLTFLSGTLLMPSIMVLAAVAGLTEREQRLARPEARSPRPVAVSSALPRLPSSARPPARLG